MKISKYPDATLLTGTERILLDQAGETKTAAASALLALITSVLIEGAHGEALTLQEMTEQTAVASGVQTQDTTATVPAGAVVFGASVRVLTQPGGTGTMSVRGAVSGHQFNGDDVATTAGSTDSGIVGCPLPVLTAESLTYTFDVPTTDAAGQIRCAVLYYAITPPTA